MREIFRISTDFVFVFSMIFIWLMLLYQFLLSLGGFLFWKRLNSKKTPAGRQALPGVSILIPARNEERVIGDLLAAVQMFDYPRELLEIIIINDGSRDRTGDIVREASKADPRIRLIDIPPPLGGRGKSAVLNRGLQIATHDFIAVYDADNRPEEKSLAILCRSLVQDEKLAAVTGKFRPYNRNRNLLTRLVNMETLAFQWIVQAGRSRWLKIAILPGTNYVIRRSALTEAGGWDEEALCEDSELTFRLYQMGYRVAFQPNAVTWEQEPESLKVWLRQRTRWARGMLYLLEKYGRRMFRNRPDRTSLELLNLFFLYYLFLFALFFSDLLFILSWSGAIRIRVMGPYAILWGLAFVLYILEIQLALAYEREESVSSLFLSILAYLAYTKLWIIVVLKSFWEEFISSSERAWIKTERFPLEVTKQKENTIKK